MVLMDDLTSRALVEGFRAGNKDCFDELWAAHRELVKGVVYKITPDAVDDLTQLVALKLMSALGSYRGESKFSVWLYRVATNEALMFKRFERLEEKLLIGIEDEHKDFIAGPDDVFAEVHFKQVLKKLRKAIRLTPYPKSLEIVAGDDWGICGMSQPAFKSRLHRSRVKLKKILASMGVIDAKKAGSNGASNSICVF